MLFEIDRSGIEKELKPVNETTLYEENITEKELEDLLADNITTLIREEYLMAISQERPLKEEPDILALDKNGALYIFELKRTESEPEHLLQVLRYGQKFGIFDYESLNKKYRHFTGIKNGLAEDHKEYFNLTESLSIDQFNNKQKFVVVTNGVDMPTLRSIRYWQDQGLPLEPLIYRTYNIGGKLLIDFNPYSGQKNEFEIVQTHNHIVNTNATYNPRAYLEMLNKNKVAAYRGKAHAMDSIRENDRVFLYHNKVGICAVGRATSDVQEKGFERFVKCHFKKKIDPIREPEKALSAAEINAELSVRWSFRQTRFSPSEEEAEKIEKLFMVKKADSD